MTETESEIEVPFDVYKNYCSHCIFKIETLTPTSVYLEMHTRLDDRGKVKIVCSQQPPCADGEWKATLWNGKVKSE